MLNKCLCFIKDFLSTNNKLNKIKYFRIVLLKTKTSIILLRKKLCFNNHIITYHLYLRVIFKSNVVIVKKRKKKR